MNDETAHPLKVFLCHASGDKPPVRDLYKRLAAEGVDAWLDQEKLLPGQDWRVEIPRAVQGADVVVICLSKKSITTEGYVQKEIKFALDVAEEKPEGTIFLIPARLEDCTVPERLSRWQWVDLYEENGFIKLLRSLKLRADAVGATIEPASYEDTDKEIERRIKQLYTEGLAAFYTEDWDRACHRFQSILSERPSHKNAAEKLAEAERQRNLSKLYAQASEAVRSEDWGTAIKTLEELSQKSADFKDAASLLKNARKQKRLQELYAEAITLHAGQKWEAVVKVFEQISTIEPAYPDPNGLLTSAQKEMAELKRLADLDDLYTNAINEMEAGRWIEARRLLEQVHKAQMGFLETERLLRKVEDEITKVEEHNQRSNQVNVLYEQAHGLLRSKKWRKALDKMEEIQELEDRFLDKDGISEKAKMELAREEREAQRDDDLSARYAEAVRLLREEKYQEALEKWQEVKAVDPKYPDRQWVQRTAEKKFTESAKPVQIKTRITVHKSLWIGIISIAVLFAVIIGTVLSSRDNQTTLPPSTSAPTSTVIVIPTATNIAYKTSTPRPDIFPATTSMPEFRIRIRIITTSDWTSATLTSGGQLKNVEILSSSSQATEASFNGAIFYLIQPLEKSGSTIVEMVAEAFLTNVTPGEPLVFGVERGHIGKTTIELWNAFAQPVLVQTLNWDGCCYDPNLHQFDVPIELFIKSSTPETVYRWDFGNGRQGWGGIFEITVPIIKDGYLTFTSTGNDPQFFSPDSLQISASNTPIITIRMRIIEGQGTVGTVYFVTSDDIYWDATKKVEFDIKDDGTFQTHNIRMSVNPVWRGVITQFRLDPTGVADAEIAIDYISVHAPY